MASNGPPLAELKEYAPGAVAHLAHLAVAFAQTRKIQDEETSKVRVGDHSTATCM